MPKVSIIIVDFKKADRVIRNVESIANQNVNFDIEVIVIDNSCDSVNADKLRTLKAYGNAVKVYINSKNLGYIRANNQGVKLATSKYLMIINPDIIWHKSDTLQKMVDFMEKYPRIGIAGPRQINENDQNVATTIRAFPKLSLQIARRTWLRNVPGIKSLVEYDEMQHLDYNQTQTVDWLQSSFWIMRKDLWQNLAALMKITLFLCLTRIYVFVPGKRATK